MKQTKRRRLKRLIIVAVAVLAACGGVISGLVLLQSKAATYTIVREAETATNTGAVAKCTHAGASGGSMQRFGSQTCPPPPIPPGQPIGWGGTINNLGGGYPRFLKLRDGSWMHVVVIGLSPTRSELAMNRSTDNMRTWHYVNSVHDGNRLVDNGMLYQAPNGDLLLSGRNLVNGSNYKISQWRSTNNGASWTREADLKNAGRGAWEPFYHTASNNRTVVTWSDENYGGYSQVIVQRVSSDNGRTWGGESIIVSDGGNGRPGMSVVSRMTNGQFILVYEICGTRGCRVYNKKSGDGVGWPGGIGSNIPGQVCGPFVTSLTTGRVVVTACRVSDSNYTTPISYSDDFGVTWRSNTPAFTDAGIYGHWPSLYQTGPDELVAVSANRMRIGTFGPR